MRIPKIKVLDNCDQDTWDIQQLKNGLVSALWWTNSVIATCKTFFGAKS